MKIECDWCNDGLTRDETRLILSFKEKTVIQMPYKIYAKNILEIFFLLEQKIIFMLYGYTFGYCIWRFD